MTKQRLDISQISPGMKLAEPIVNSSGMTLMPTGIRITPLFISRLKKWNIQTVEVFVEDADGTSKDGRQRREASSTREILTAEQEEFARSIAVEVSSWFANVRGNPLMIQLRNTAIKRLVQHGPEGQLNIMRHAAAQKEAEGNG